MDSLAFLKTVKPPDFRRGTGPDALPQGAATSLQRSGQASQAAVQQGAQSQAPVSGATSSAGGPQNQSSSQQMASGPAAKPAPIGGLPKELSDYLLSGTERPGEPITTGFQQGRQVPPPPDLAESLPALQFVASHPEAPIQIRMILDLINYHTGQSG